MMQDNEARLAALHDLTRLPLEELVKCSEACADKDPDGQREKRRTVWLFCDLYPVLRLNVAWLEKAVN